VKQAVFISQSEMNCLGYTSAVKRVVNKGAGFPHPSHCLKRGALGVPCFAFKKMMRSIKLPGRLGALADYIDKGSAVADIGTDHGYLPVYLAQTGLAERIIASDISAGSLDSARRSASRYKVAESIEFIVAPGLCGIVHSDVDTIVIAGLGGETIVDILKDAPWTKTQDIKLLLQPQSKIDVLCRFLYDNGYTIKDTKSVFDRKRRYTVIHASGG